MWLEAFSMFLSIEYILIVIGGTLLGITLGSLPGLGPAFTLALFLPMTFGMDPPSALVFLGVLYSSSVFGGCITAILINAPGTPGSVATTFDGYPLAQQGKGGLALGAAATASLVGGIFGFIALATISPLIASIALKFNPATYFMLALFGLSMVAFAAHGNTLKGLMLAGFGLLISFIGRDPVSGGLRFTFDNIYLEDGISFVPSAIGLFALSQAFVLIGQGGTISKIGGSIGKVSEGVIATFKRPINLTRSSITGVVLGAIPGVGISIANFVAYMFEQRSSKKPKSYGKGNVGGVVAPESANNATTVSELIPAITLGLPGGATSAIFLAAITLHGLEPGASFFSSSSSVSYIVFVGMLLAQFAFFIVALIGMKHFVRVTSMPNELLGAGVITLALVGAYAYNYKVTDMLIAIAFGVLGYILVKYKYPLAPLILGLVLGSMVESNYRRALLMSDGSYGIFFTPIPLTILIVTILILASPMIIGFIKKLFNKSDGGLTNTHSK
ncbi:tripartite tricarboxylate transporter permease [Alteribacillus sp. YIM 98480]|uniref:tripartite tricarboxylate transporter permease n=1 Tax=Alteribacillus sp. YIM 98480 TaxID=2606599 RepID=UPI00131CA8FD|nr:tripartite tricarboxylate transporter permease [Alteribacillus sp. YIM 98480]